MLQLRLFSFSFCDVYFLAYFVYINIRSVMKKYWTASLKLQGIGCRRKHKAILPCYDWLPVSTCVCILRSRLQDTYIPLFAASAMRPRQRLQRTGKVTEVTARVTINCRPACVTSAKDKKRRLTHRQSWHLPTNTTTSPESV